MRDAVIALRNAGSATGPARSKSLALAADLEAAILARIKGAPAAVESNAKKEQIQDLIAGVEELLRQQRDIFRETNATENRSAKMLSERQDALAEQSSRVRKQVGDIAQNAAMGDKAFRDRLTKVASMLGELRIYDDMLAAADAAHTLCIPMKPGGTRSLNLATAVAIVLYEALRQQAPDW